MTKRRERAGHEEITVLTLQTAKEERVGTGKREKGCRGGHLLALVTLRFAAGPRDHRRGERIERPAAGRLSGTPTCYASVLSISFFVFSLIRLCLSAGRSSLASLMLLVLSADARVAVFREASSFTLYIESWIICFWLGHFCCPF